MKNVTLAIFLLSTGLSAHAKVVNVAGQASWSKPSNYGRNIFNSLEESVLSVSMCEF